MLAGTLDNTLFPALDPWLRPLGSLLDPPVWSLHVELYGSLLVLGLVRIKAASTRLHAAAIVVSGVLLMPHPLILFVIGHLAARLLPPGAGRDGAVRRAGSAVSVPLIAAGVLLSTMSPQPWLRGIDTMFLERTVVALPQMYQAFALQRMLGAILVFSGVLASGQIWRALSARPLRRLGQLSFGIYLVHFPILFTLTSLGFTVLSPHLPYTACLLAVVVGGGAVTLVVAAWFERWIDRPAMRLAHAIGAGRVRPAVGPTMVVS
jgi:peptidoglycan/LPS O-acetylase OafA/YrhL